jgi:hypothetical protein
MASSVTTLEEVTSEEGMKTGNETGGVEKAMDGGGIPNGGKDAGVETTPVFCGAVVVPPVMVVGCDASKISTPKG